MADWTKPTVSSAYTDFPNEVKDRDVDAITLLEGRSPTNLPDKAKKFNTSVGRIESWSSSGSTWNAEKLAHNEALTYSGDSGGYHISSADYTLVSGLSHELDSLTDAEVLQLQNINSVTISNTQWGWVGGLSSSPLESGNNLSDVSSASSSIDNLGALDASENLSDVGSASTSRSNLGLGTAATKAADQDLATSDAVTFGTVNTGAGDNELYPMDQAVRTTDDITVNSITISAKQSAELNHDFNPGYYLYFQRIGDVVHISCQDEIMWGPSSATHLTSLNTVPSSMRPSRDTHFVTLLDGSWFQQITIRPGGDIQFTFYDWSGGSGSSKKAYSFGICYLLPS